MAIVISGIVDILKEDSNGDDKPIAVLGLERFWEKWGSSMENPSGLRTRPYRNDAAGPYPRNVRPPHEDKPRLALELSIKLAKISGRRLRKTSGRLIDLSPSVINWRIHAAIGYARCGAFTAMMPRSLSQHCFWYRPVLCQSRMNHRPLSTTRKVHTPRIVFLCRKQRPPRPKLSTIRATFWGPLFGNAASKHSRHRANSLLRLVTRGTPPTEEWNYYANLLYFELSQSFPRVDHEKLCRMGHGQMTLSNHS